MANFFGILLFVSLVFLVWGLVAPHKLSKFSKKPFTRRDAGIGFGILSLVFFIMVGVTAPKSDISTTQSKTTKAASLPATKATPQQKLSTVTTKTVTETSAIPFDTTTANDPTMNKGTSSVTTKGVNGTKTSIYQVTYTNGVQTKKTLVKTAITTPPITQVTSVGTYVKPAQPKTTTTASNCDPNYSGACVPDVYPSDVDCAGGSGNGPYYVQGPVRVIGKDIYHLDSDGNGIGCE